MTKLLVLLSKNTIQNLESADAYLIGLKGYSVNTPLDISLDEITKLNQEIKENKKELFISINKNMYNHDVELLRELLLEIDKLNINGIFFADPALVRLKKELHLKTNLVWSQEHATTNYGTIQFWSQYGVDYTYLSGEITKEEILEIRQNTNQKLIVPIFGYLPMYTSFRHAVSNYLNHFHLNSNTSIYYLEKEGKLYPIVDNEIGTVTYSNNILNGYLEYLEFIQHKIDYVTLNSFQIEDSIFEQILNLFQNKIAENEEKINQLLNHQVDKGFFYKETIYRVKKVGEQHE